MQFIIQSYLNTQYSSSTQSPTYTTYSSHTAKPQFTPWSTNTFIDTSRFARKKEPPCELILTHKL